MQHNDNKKYDQNFQYTAQIQYLPSLDTVLDRGVARILEGGGRVTSQKGLRVKFPVL